MARGAAMSQAMEKAHPHERHFYLFFMAVAPYVQGMGLGSAILDAAMKRIDEVGTSAYLENSNPKNTRLYERAGFVAQKNISPQGAPPLRASGHRPCPESQNLLRHAVSRMGARLE